LQGSKGRCHGNPFLAKRGKNITKWPQLQLYASIHAEFGFDIGFVLSGNSYVTLQWTRVKGALPWQPNFGENKPKYHKNGHNFSCMQHINAEFGFGIEFVLWGNSSMTLPYTRDKGALPWQPMSGLKLL